jgi:hypothetical protein
VNAPTPPPAINALPTGAPVLASASGLSAPGLSGDSLGEIFVPEPEIQVAALIEMAPTGSGPGLDGADSSGPASIAPSLNPLSFDTATGAFLVFAGGRGDALEEERRR